jgi:hypothetical protein
LKQVSSSLEARGSLELVLYASADAHIQSFGKENGILVSTNSIGADKADFIDVVLTDYVFLAAPGREFADAAQVDGLSQDSWAEHLIRPVPQPHEIRRAVRAMPAEI